MENMQRKILVVNDDGYDAPGIYRLAKAARAFGQVTVVAPEFHCSAKSHSITLRDEMRLIKRDIGLKDVEAYSLSGMPADCVRVALCSILPEYPDIVFSGINDGSNCGFDIAYSGTAGAALEAAMHDLPAIAFSRKGHGLDEIADAYLQPMMELLMHMPLNKGEIWNVNFPGISLSQCKGVLWNRNAASSGVFRDHYDARTGEDGILYIREVPEEIPMEQIRIGSDLRAMMEGYVSVGKVKSHVYG